MKKKKQIGCFDKNSISLNRIRLRKCTHSIQHLSLIYKDHLFSDENSMTNSESQVFAIQKNNHSGRSKTLEQHQSDIEEYINKRNGKIIDKEWRFIGKNRRKTPFFNIKCNRECGFECDEKKQFWIIKYDVKSSNRYPEGKWCSYKKINKSLSRHQKDIEEIVREKKGNIINSEWKYIGKNKDKKPYYCIECRGENESSERHRWWVEKNKIIRGSWCPQCPKGKTLEEHKKDIIPIVKKKGGIILDNIWKRDEKRKYPYFYIECEGNKEYQIKHKFWIYKNDLLPNKNHPKGIWCRECQNKSLEQHQSDIEEYIEWRGGEILGKRWKYVNQGKYKAKTPYFYIECNNKEEKHRWWVTKGNLIPKPSNPNGSWCLICNDRIRAISEYAHIVIEYYCLSYLNLKNCSGRYEYILDGGSRPDLIIFRDDNFISYIEPYQNIISFSYNKDLTNIEEIAVDFTMSLIPSNILKKCFRNYQNKKRYLIIVLLREEGSITPKYMQDLINNDIDLDEKEKGLINVMNFDEFLLFLNLDTKLDLLNFNKWNSFSEEIKEIILMFQKTIKLSINAIESGYVLEKLKKTSEILKNRLH